MRQEGEIYMTEKKFSKQAFDCLQELKKAVDQCNGSRVAAKSACMYGNIETAFYEKEIGTIEMDMFKTKTDMLITKFDTFCKCSKR